MDPIGNSDFWGAIAQIAPLLALTLVLEARYSASRWHDRTPRPLKWSQVVVYMLAGLGTMLALFAAFARLLDADAFAMTPAAVIWIVGGVLGIVIFGPLVGVFIDPPDGKGLLDK